MIIKEPFKKYLSCPAYSPSSFKAKKSPRQVKYDKDNPDETIKHEWVIGHAVHTMIMEPHLMDEDFIIADYNDFPVQSYNKDGSISMRPDSNKDHLAAILITAGIEGKEVLFKDEKDILNDIKNALGEQLPNYQDLFTDGMVEISLYGIAIFDEHGIFQNFEDLPDKNYKPNKNELIVKTRPDFINSFLNRDIKTTKSAYPKFFAKDSFNLGYDIQLAFGIDLFCQIAPMNDIVVCDIEKFKAQILALETSEPYHCVLFDIPEEMIDIGRKRYQNRLMWIKHSIDSAKWMGYEISSDNLKEDYPTVLLPFPNYYSDDQRW